MDRDDKYERLLNVLPSEIRDKFIIPLANEDIFSHDSIVRFLFVIYDKGYSIQKQSE